MVKRYRLTSKNGLWFIEMPFSKQAYETLKAFRSRHKEYRYCRIKAVLQAFLSKVQLGLEQSIYGSIGCKLSI